MTKLKELRKAATVSYDCTGKTVVQIPLELWERYVAENLLANEKTLPSADQLRANIHARLKEAEETSLIKRAEVE
jgi:hypothetical protein